ncbi:MAG: tyrosine-type recombinase/integrase [Armatimonadota bacterium]|nr:tyrosine-type recombinase/integrase [bacterium]
MARTNVVRIPGYNSVVEDLQAAVDSFFAYCKGKNLSERTIEYYGHRLQAFRRYLEAAGESTAPKDFTPQTIRAFLTDEADKKSSTTASHSHITLSTFFNYMMDEGYLESSPMANVDRPKRRKTVIHTFSMDQVDSVLSTCGKDFLGARDRAVVMMLVDCGLRASEVAGLEMNDFNWTDCTVLVLGKGDKERVVPFGNATRQALNAYVARRGELDTDAFFVSSLGGQMDRYRIRDIIERRCELANIKGIRCSPHTFRHTFAVSYLRNGGDVFSLQKMLGHTDLTMTRRYAELSQTDVQDKHRLYSPADRLNAAKQTKGRKRLK